MKDEGGRRKTGRPKLTIEGLPMSTTADSSSPRRVCPLADFGELVERWNRT
jgi:hypothetical protein